MGNEQLPPEEIRLGQAMLRAGVSLKTHTGITAEDRPGWLLLIDPDQITPELASLATQALVEIFD